jgi:hypothetical protein
MLNDKGQYKIGEFNALYSLPRFISFFFSGVCFKCNMNSGNERFIQNVDLNVKRKKSSSEKPGHSKDENTTLGFSRSRVLWWN